MAKNGGTLQRDSGSALIATLNRRLTDMPNANKQRGDRWEREVVDLMQAAGLTYVERAYGAGRHDDRGDLDGLPRWIVDCKDHAQHDFPGWLDSIHGKKRRADDYGAAIVKRRRRPAHEGYVVLRLDDFARLLAEIESGDE